MILRAAVIERDGGSRIELEVVRLGDNDPPAGAALCTFEGDRPWTDDEVASRARAWYRGRMPSPRHGLHIDLRPAAEQIWKRCWADRVGPGQVWLEAWCQRLHLVHDYDLLTDKGKPVPRGFLLSLCGRTVGPAWYVVDDQKPAKALARALPRWAAAGPLRCAVCESAWEKAMLEHRLPSLTRAQSRGIIVSVTKEAGDGDQVGRHGEAVSGS